TLFLSQYKPDTTKSNYFDIAQGLINSNDREALSIITVPSTMDAQLISLFLPSDSKIQFSIAASQSLVHHHRRLLCLPDVLSPQGVLPTPKFVTQKSLI
ncbi:MAG: hypothetical protein ACKN96_06800, partial [Actinomycetota bacterium]